VLCRIRLHEHISFLAKPTLARFLETIAIGSRLEIDATRAKHVHHDVRELIADFRETAVLRKIDLRLVGLDLPPSASAH
jgi:MFS superfamily sulfate permease-like transporter